MANKHTRASGRLFLNRVPDDQVHRAYQVRVGCGVGYFSLKLAPKVAERGSVLAEDILGVSFLDNSVSRSQEQLCSEQQSPTRIVLVAWPVRERDTDASGLEASSRSFKPNCANGWKRYRLVRGQTR